ncbi:ACP S-malonyltransferase [Macrococcoides canis]|uniref:Malonyl CoA-acyl carrier protein transacylase n=1 Tax=Macrococcoides canis TaxID=1855823 RepID=A0AAE6X0H5_9STAP|nr:ACP S-malonyltransferase [Macrococcus canis]QCT74652.1 [acyl-carrier-protein] S-malonyltransferase [Macrococcus canis]QIH75720.1 ACP S-malonyltransferase [Macrococcus canis]QIH78166.1 ACP S-malonyltransferase [Macrococcus canis]QNR07665.1 ACP S-malonyltransferase [Macrococcus canis]
MSKRALLFPGQGSQFIGMTEDFNEQGKDTINELNSLLDIDLVNIMYNDDAVNETQYTQPAILMHSVALLAQFQQSFDYCLGHSLGEYSALVASGVLTQEDAVQIVYKRGQLMSAAYPQGVGKMAAIMGTERNVIEAACTAVSNDEHLLNIANINGPGQIVVSGHAQSIDALIDRKQELGLKKIIPLNVSGPFHSELMKVIEAEFRAYLEQFDFQDAHVPVVQNVNALPETDAKRIKENLVKQLYAPVEFTDSILFLIDQGVTEFIEIGPKKVLTALVKKIDRNVTVKNITTTNEISEV